MGTQWEGINEFVAVAEANSFTQASQKLALSTAQVSRQVSALEQRLNVKLFYRTTRKVSLTQEGQVFYQHCRSVLDGLSAAEQAITQLQTSPKGKIQLSAPITYGEQQVVPLVNNFILQYPEIEVRLHLTNHRENLIEEGFDLAVRLGKLKDSSLIAKYLAPRINHVCASPHYLATQGEPHSLSELHQHNCLLGTRDYWQFKQQNKEKHIRVHGNLRCNSGVALVDAALKNIGIIQLPGFYVDEHIKTGQLIPLLTQYSLGDEGVWAVYPNNKFVSPKIRLFIDYLSQNLNS
ncbi:LysR family transcriptional regulator [Algibacillus agarilyticus]|uniref:LysR family transcriptional regulator n=1 Tax=Algibacillus agarilyticus TaxID=2234133 RepID=UPI000DD05A41|nr:LysR family transcriptional regulator [Algibacillus agarilyticus]